ncbi:MAG: hypothetical protein J6C95_06815 [Muribaculaceae bacterium]|nr:hypothetical protein [Muribaculaceae bacterium]
MKIPFFTRGLDASAVSILVERFLDGDTTPAQEKAIYHFYALHRDLPDELERYRDMFAWYAGMQPRGERRPRHAIAAAAAAVLVVAGIGLSVIITEKSEENSLYASYQGSYIVRNGQRIDDIQAIYNSLAVAEQYADSILHEADREAVDLERNCEQTVIDHAFSSINDPDMARELKKEMFE